MRVQSLAGEDPPRKGMATHSSIVAWRIPVDTQAWQATIHRAAKSWKWLKQLSMHARCNLASLPLYSHMNSDIYILQNKLSVSRTLVLSAVSFRNIAHYITEWGRLSQFSCSVMCNSLRPHRLRHAKLPCPSPTPRACSDSGPLSQWCHPTISSSVILFSSCPQSFPASGSFQITQFFLSGGQSIGVSASASALLMNIQDLISFRMDWLDPLAVQGSPKSLLQHHSLKAPVLRHSVFFVVQLSHPYMTTGDYWKNHSFH